MPNPLVRFRNDDARIRAYGMTQAKYGGRGRPNQDAFCCKKNGLYVVADGVSNSANPQAASRLAVKTLVECCTASKPDKDTLVEAVLLANERVCNIKTVTPAHDSSATTLTAVWIDKTDLRAPFLVVHLGDSSFYYIDPRNMLATWHKTTQHNDEEGRITHYLGRPDLTADHVEKWEGQMRVGTRLLLCSDGMRQAFYHFGWTHILEAIYRQDMNLRQQTEALMKMACFRPSRLDRSREFMRNDDDVTLVLVEREFPPE